MQTTSLLTICLLLLALSTTHSAMLKSKTVEQRKVRSFSPLVNQKEALLLQVTDDEFSGTYGTSPSKLSFDEEPNESVVPTVVHTRNTQYDEVQDEPVVQVVSSHNTRNTDFDQVPVVSSNGTLIQLTSLPVSDNLLEETASSLQSSDKPPCVVTKIDADFFTKRIRTETEKAVSSTKT